MTWDHNKYHKQYYHQHKHQTPPVITINLQTTEEEVIIPLYEYLDALTKTIQYQYNNLPEGLTLDQLEEKIQNGEWRIL